MTDNVLYGIDFRAHSKLLALSKAMAPEECFVDVQPLMNDIELCEETLRLRMLPDKDSA